MPIFKIPTLPQATSVDDLDLIVVETVEGTKSIPRKLLVPLPDISSDDAGKSLKVSETGDWVVEDESGSNLVSPASWFTVNETGETITGLSEEGKLHSDFVIPSVINGVTITTLEQNAFQGCDNIVHMILPDSLTTIKAGVFIECTNLVEMEVPDSVTSFADSVFCACSNLKRVVIGSGVIRLSGTFINCGSLSEIILKDGLQDLNSGNFTGDIAVPLQSLVIPKSVTTIRQHAFLGLSPESFTAYYEGTEDEWFKITEESSGSLNNYKVVFNYGTKVKDWNENNPNSEKYIENRTHWEYLDDANLAMHKTIVDCNTEGTDWGYVTDFEAHYLGTLPNSIDLDSSDIFTIFFDGQYYECIPDPIWGEEGIPTPEVVIVGTCIGGNLGNAFGDVYSMEPELPFAICGDTIAVYEQGEHTVAVWKGTKSVQKLDSKYLNSEEWVFTLEDGSTVTKKVVLG